MKHNQDGVINVLLLPLIIASLFLVGALSFGYWAFSERQHYKDHSDEIVASAVDSAKQSEDTLKAKEYAEASKLPLKTYTGPEQLGSLKIQYPKTWSGYVDIANNGANGFDGYFNPDVVPSVTDQASTFALRVKIVPQSYSSVLQQFQNLKGISVTPYALPNVPKVVGVKITGQIEQNKQGTIVVLPLRTTALEIFSEAPNYQADFNSIILPNFSFAP